MGFDFLGMAPILRPAKTSMKYLVAALYHFAHLPQPQALQAPLLALCQQAEVQGTLILAREGINGTIAGPEAGVRQVLAHIRQIPHLAELEHKESWAEQPPFLRMKVKIKNEIVTMRVPEIDPSRYAGTYVQPEDWNALIQDPDVLLVDTRNDYEVNIGTFAGAINPNIDTFVEFPDWIQNPDNRQGKKKIAMFCTGGIRCEKSTAYLRQQGFDEVYHLKGGILKYLESVPAEDSLWQGECFVFDERVSVGHGLAVGDYELCRACRHPISAEDQASPLYEAGISCPHCHGSHSPEQLHNLRERQKQIALARARGERHVGKASSELEAQRRAKRERLASQRERSATSKKG